MTTNSPMPRRTFLATGTAALAATALAPNVLRAARSANERFTLGVMGLNGRGKALANVLAAQPDVDIAYLCDVDQAVIGPCVEVVAKNQQCAPQAVADFRRILDDRAVDGLAIATPDHWHALATIHGCAAGKHVLVEKPCSHNVIEGERMLAAARKHSRHVQVDTQRRSSASMKAMVDFLQSGGVGKLHFARSWITSRRENIGHSSDEPTPTGVDYELWLGPAPRARSTAITSTIAGTGSGSTARASWGTMAYMASIWPAGDWASTCRHRSCRAVRSNSSTTTRSRPTRRWCATNIQV